MVICDMIMTMKEKYATVSAAKFKAECLALLDAVQAKRSSFVVTKRGRPVARVVPLHLGDRGSLRGSLLHDDKIMNPVDAEWESA